MFWHVLVPLLAPGILAASLLVLVRTIAMFELTFLTAGPDSQTLVVALYYAVFAAGVRAPQSVDAMAMIYMVVTLVWLLIALRFVNPTQLVSRVKEASAAWHVTSMPAGTPATKLSAATLDRVPRSVARPAYAVDTLGIGIVHLGIGAFHRAHQAMYTDDALGQVPGTWGICGVSLRSPDVRDRMTPQDGLYTAIEKSPAGVRRRIVGSVREVLFLPDAREQVRERLAAPRHTDRLADRHRKGLLPRAGDRPSRRQPSGHRPRLAESRGASQRAGPAGCRAGCARAARTARR